MVRFFVGLCFVIGILQGSPLKVDITSKAAILMNAETGEVLYEKEAHKASYPASITKMVTGLYAIEKMGHNLDSEMVAHPELLVTVQPHEKYPANPLAKPYVLEVGGIHIGILPGERLSFRTLLYGLLISSGNDAANVIAHHVSGDLDKFIQDINLFLREKGCRETLFLNPHGLHHGDHQTTAYDMALFAREALKNPTFANIVKTVKVTRPKSNKQGQSFLIQTNRLLKPGQYYYPKAIGLKTGHTSAAGYTLVAAAEHNNRRLIAVVLGATDRYARYRDVIKLFETAFAEEKVSRKVFSKAHDHFQRAIPGGNSELIAELKDDFYISYYPAEEPHVQSRISWDEAVLPIHAGDVVGRVELLSDQGRVVGVECLIATRDVDVTLWGGFMSGLKTHRKMIILMLLFGNIVASLVYFFKKSKKVI